MYITSAAFSVGAAAVNLILHRPTYRIPLVSSSTLDTIQPTDTHLVIRYTAPSIPTLGCILPAVLNELCSCFESTVASPVSDAPVLLCWSGPFRWIVSSGRYGDPMEILSKSIAPIGTVRNQLSCIKPGRLAGHRRVRLTNLRISLHFTVVAIPTSSAVLQDVWAQESSPAP